MTGSPIDEYFSNPTKESIEDYLRVFKRNAGHALIVPSPYVRLFKRMGVDPDLYATSKAIPVGFNAKGVWIDEAPDV